MRDKGMKSLTVARREKAKREKNKEENMDKKSQLIYFVSSRVFYQVLPAAPWEEDKLRYKLIPVSLTPQDV